jgi:thiamine biosynthesis lipoprotein
MFTRIDVLICADAARNDLVEIVKKIENEIGRIESFSNRFDENSELGLINSNAFAEEILVSDELFHIIEECLLYNQKTSGCFDITVNSFNAFRFGIANIRLNAEQKSIRFLHSDVQLDFSGFIKGYSLRSVREMLIKEQLENVLVNVGNSSILAMGNHPHGRGWKISSPTIHSTTECILQNECLTTSGNSALTKWPVVHPKTGEFLTKSESVSVVTDDPAYGEVLSTTLYVMEANQKETLLKQYGAKEIIW